MTLQTAAREGWQVEGGTAEAYERYLAQAFSPWAQQLVAYAGIADGERVLDLACGTGIVARHAAARTGSTGSVTGCDVNDDMLRVARTVCGAVTPSIEWRQASAGDLPFADAAFDAVLCEQGLQFFSDPARAVAEVRRVLAPGGRFVASLCRPLRYCPAYVALSGALERHVSADAGAMMRSPFSRWSAAELRTLLAGAGFSDVRVLIDVSPLRYPSCAEFLRIEAACSPLAGPIGAMTDRARADLVRDLEEALADHLDDEGLVCPLEVYVVKAS